MPEARTESYLTALAEEVIRRLCAGGKTIALAESCTAGLVADFLARIPGASKVFWGSFVTYMVDAKIKMLEVPEELIKTHGTVSRPVALAMAQEAIKKSGASLALSVTGLAGPEGDASGVPTGTVWIGIADCAGQSNIHSEAKLFSFKGSRNEVREAAAATMLKEVLLRINEK
jgi:PncC family amidohydrolase